MKKRLFTALLALVMISSLCVSAFAYDYMNPPEPGAADGFVETKSEWNSSAMLPGHWTVETSYTFDDEGRILTRTETTVDENIPENNGTATYLYEYDAEGRLSCTAQEDGNHEFVYTYNDDGTHLLTYTWWSDDESRENPNVNYRTYDPCEGWYWFGKWHFTYDEHGNTARRWDDSGSDWVYENTYDDAGRLTKVTMTSQSDGVQTYQTYTYNADGSYVKFWGSRTGGEEFTYNAKGQLVKYDDLYSEAGAWTYEYDENGNNIRRSYGSGDRTAVMEYEYAPIPTPAPAPTNPFTDVAESAYYYEPVLWAVNHDPQITKGMSETTFSPEAECTRGQIVTFLWRAMGEPEPTSTVNDFVDVKPDDYFCKAVLWAAEKGITNGVDATHFGPNKSCTRAQAVTFLWRAENKPAAKTQQSDFTDVQNASAYYYTPVLWAVENGITNGTSATTFSPDATCKRGQIVTFLYRDLKG